MLPMKMLNLVCDRLSSFITKSYFHRLLIWLSVRLGDSDKINSIPVLFSPVLPESSPGSTQESETLLLGEIPQVEPGRTYTLVTRCMTLLQCLSVMIRYSNFLILFLLSYLSVMTRYFYYMHRGIIRDPRSTFWIYMVDSD